MFGSKLYKIKKAGSVLPKYPEDHPVGERVPDGGSNCAKCEYLDQDTKKDCNNKFFQQWRKNLGVKNPKRIPGKITAYCCDFFPEEEEEKSEAKPKKAGRS